MSPLARLLRSRGLHVAGSDRSFDSGTNHPFFQRLTAEGIELFPQDGSGITSSLTGLIVTRAVEDNNADIKAARELGLPIWRRPSVVAELFSKTRNILIGGTAGKSTTTAMIAHVLRVAGMPSTVLNGALMLDFESNFVAGDGGVAVLEADESDGAADVIGVCKSDISVLTNVSRDHHSLEKLVGIFSAFIRDAREAVVLNSDCPNSYKLIKLHRNVLLFGMSADAVINPRSLNLQLRVPGSHNVMNALAAVAACSAIGVESNEAAKILREFSGVKRRLETVGVARGITVIDDFASNGAKIAASIRAIQERAARITVIFQPHGFGPTKDLKDDYIDTFLRCLRKDDLLVMPDIFYTGGSVNYVDGSLVPLPTDISSKDIVDAVAIGHPAAFYVPRRADIPALVKEHAREGDMIIVMGSRDETLPVFARDILAGLSE